MINARPTGVNSVRITPTRLGRAGVDHALNVKTSFDAGTIWLHVSKPRQVESALIIIL